MSHPAWVCGLKQLRCTNIQNRNMSHPAWVCGLKPNESEGNLFAVKVTPCVGVWIETYNKAIEAAKKGHTLRGCVD